MPLHREFYINPQEKVDHATQSISEFNEINRIHFIDSNLLELYNNDPIEEFQYIIGIMMSLAAIYYFVYEIIKKVLG
tara:strand:+ start:4562 stop:4792 length:231 start_codon:yes stop_codon:yes gene_type:complete